MSRYYRILEKAKLAEALFAPETDAEAREQEEAERSWSDATTEVAPREADEAPATAVSPNPAEAARPSALEAKPAPASEPAAVPEPEPEPESEPQLEPELESQPKPELKPAPAPGPDWTELLAEATGAASALGKRRLLVCPCIQATRAAPLLVGLAEWVHANGGGETLIVEANFVRPRLANLLQTRSRGLDRFAPGISDRVEDAVQPSGFEGISALPAGRTVRSPSKILAAYADRVPEIVERFDSMLVETPAANDRALSRFPFDAHDASLLLAVDPQITTAKQIFRAVERLESLGAPYIGAILCRRQGHDASVRVRRVARQVGGS